MGSIDDMKKKLNIDDLDKSKRGEMFNKFVEKGGKVINDKSSNVVKFNRNAQRRLKEKEEQSKKKQLNSTPGYKQKASAQKTSSGARSGTDKNAKKYYFRVFFTGLTQSVFSLSSYFNKRFAYEMQDNLLECMAELHQIGEQISNLNPEKKWQIFDAVNKHDSYAYEVILRIHHLYKESEFNKIIHYFKTNNYIICPSIIKELYTLFRELLVLYPYWESCKAILWEALLFYETINHISPYTTKSKLSKHIDKLFSYYMPRIFTICNYNLSQKLPYEYDKMFTFAKIKPDEEMGSMTRIFTDEKKQYYEVLKKEKEEAMKKTASEQEKPANDKLPKYLIRGLEIINSIIRNIPVLVKENKNAAQLEEKEKMLELYSLISEFDTEYSFILTTSQIKFNSLMEDGVRIDMKSDLESLYIRFNEILNGIKGYFDLQSQFKRINESFNGSSYQKEKQLTEINKKRYQSFKEIRAQATVFYKRISLVLQTIIKDYNGEKRLIQNPEDKLKFQLEKDRKKKFENVTVINALLYAFSFCSAFYHHLTTGKISQQGLYFNNEQTNSAESGITAEDNSQPTV